MNSLSYSHYGLLRTCGYKYKLVVLDKAPEEKQVHFEFGSAIHAGLHTALDTHDIDAALDVFETYWSTSQTGLDYAGERFKCSDLNEMGVKFIANFYKRYGKDMKIVVAEKRMFSKLNGLDCEGTADVLVEWNGQNVLLDYKTSGYNYEPEKTDTSLQLNFYAWLLEENGYKVDALGYVVFNKGAGSVQQPKIVPYNRIKALTMIRDMVSYFIRNGEHYERNYNACVNGKFKCPFIERCLSEQSKTSAK